MMSGDTQKHIKKKKILEIYAGATSYKYQHGLTIIHFRAKCDVNVFVTCVLKPFQIVSAFQYIFNNKS